MCGTRIKIIPIYFQNYNPRFFINKVNRYPTLALTIHVMYRSTSYLVATRCHIYLHRNHLHLNFLPTIFAHSPRQCERELGGFKQDRSPRWNLGDFVVVHPQLSHNGCPIDHAPMGARLNIIHRLLNIQIIVQRLCDPASVHHPLEILLLPPCGT